MSADRDMTRIVRSWLRTDEHESADRVLDSVLALLDATPQRRSWWPSRRIADMNNTAKLATAIAAVVVAAFVGLNLLPAGGGPGGAPTPSPSPSSSSSSSSPASPSAPTPSSTPSAPAASVAFPPAGALEAGRYSLTEAGVEFSLEVADGWSSSGLNCSVCTRDSGYLQKGPDGAPESAWILIWSIDGVAADPCGHTPAPRATSGAELAAGVAELPGADLVTGPEDVTVGGRSAKHVVIMVPEDIECAPNDFYMWYDDIPAEGGFRWATSLGQTNRVWIIDVDGTRVWIEAETYKGASPELDQEIQAMIDSIQFE